MVCLHRSRVLLLICPTLFLRFIAAPVTVLWCFNPTPPMAALPPSGLPVDGNFSDMCFVILFPFSICPKAEMFFALCIPSSLICYKNCSCYCSRREVKVTVSTPNLSGHTQRIISSISWSMSYFSVAKLLIKPNQPRDSPEDPATARRPTPSRRYKREWPPD